jgi:hypothetical protein
MWLLSHTYSHILFHINIYIRTYMYSNMLSDMLPANLSGIQMSSGQHYQLNLLPCPHYGRPLSDVRISIFPEVSQVGYQYRVVP